MRDRTLLAALLSLAGIKGLTDLDVSETQVTDDGVKAFQKLLPKCRVRK